MRTYQGAGLSAPFFALLLAACLVLLAGCREERETETSDLVLAQRAVSRSDTADAAMYFERYLRRNPQGEMRWQVWKDLVDITLNLRQERETARAYLEIMLAEYWEFPERRRNIALSLAALCRSMRDDARAVPLWEELAADSGLQPEERATVYRELAGAYLRRLEFTSATDSLQACLELSVSSGVKAECLYDMGEIQMLTDDLPLSAISLRTLLHLDGVEEKRRVLAAFMLADVLEQQGQRQEALELFESIRDTYPNEKVVQARIIYLKNGSSGPPS